MSVTPIGQLIVQTQRDFLALHGVELTFGDIARRSGGRVLRNRVQQFAKDPVKAMPSPDTVQGLADGLGVPYRDILAALLLSAGYTLPTGWRSLFEDTPAPARLDLDDSQRRSLRAEAEATMAARRGSAHRPA